MRAYLGFNVRGDHIAQNMAGVAAAFIVATPAAQTDRWARVTVDPRFTAVGVNTWNLDCIAQWAGQVGTKLVLLFNGNNPGSAYVTAWPGVTAANQAMATTDNQQRYARWVVDCWWYMRNVKHVDCQVQITNEWDLTQFATPVDPLYHAQTTMAVRSEFASRLAAGTIDRIPTLIGGVYSNYDDTRARTYAKSTFSLGLLSAIDVIDFHFYGDVKDIKNRLLALHTDMIDAGKIVPVIISESNLWGPTLTQAQIDAQEPVRFTSLMSAVKGLVQGVFHYQLQDHGSDVFFGVQRLDGTYRPIKDATHAYVP